MKAREDRLVEMVIELLEEVAAHNQIELPARLDSETPLFGDAGTLDSLGLVNLVVSFEQAIEDELGASVALADEKALSARSSPFRSVGTLAAYACKQLEEVS